MLNYTLLQKIERLFGSISFVKIFLKPGAFASGFVFGLIWIINDPELKPPHNLRL
jgi:hypothetical protein